MSSKLEVTIREVDNGYVVEEHGCLSDGQCGVWVAKTIEDLKRLIADLAIVARMPDPPKSKEEG